MRSRESIFSNQYNLACLTGNESHVRHFWSPSPNPCLVQNIWELGLQQFWNLFDLSWRRLSGWTLEKGKNAILAESWVMGKVQSMLISVKDIPSAGSSMINGIEKGMCRANTGTCREMKKLYHVQLWSSAGLALRCSSGPSTAAYSLWGAFKCAVICSVGLELATSHLNLID